jgi:Trypsin-like peptidase domain
MSCSVGTSKARVHSPLTSVVGNIDSKGYNNKQSEQVASYGFPYGNTLSSSGNFTLGNITALAGFGDDSTMVQVSSPMQPGNSGGPLMDSSGTIIGVSKGILGTLAAAEAAGGAVPQNVNFGVSSGTAVTFLGTRGIDAEVSVGASKLEPEAIRGNRHEIHRANLMRLKTCARDSSPRPQAHGPPRSLPRCGTVDLRAAQGAGARPLSCTVPGLPCANPTSRLIHSDCRV